MKLPITLLTILLLITACRHTYYVVRHAEKAVPSPGTTMSTPNDPPLSEAGQARAEELRKVLGGRRIKAIYSTNTVRTKSTVEPLRKKRSLTITTYGPMPDSAFIRQLRGIKRHVLVVGHSNTVDDIVNGLTGVKTIPADLADNEYDNLYIVRYMHFFGKHIRFVWRKFGAENVPLK